MRHGALWEVSARHGCMVRHLDLNLQRMAVLLRQGAAAGRSQVSRVVLPTHQRPAHSRWNAPPTVRPRHRRPGPPAWESPAWPSPGPEVSGAFRGTASPQSRLLWLVSPQQISASSSMRVFLPVLLVALLGVEQAHSLICFSCTDQKSNLKCLWPTSCSSTENYCVTVSASAGFGNVNLGYTLNKGCSEICPRENINVNLGVASVNSYCCQHSFCNISTAGLGLRASIPLLGLGLLLSLLALPQLAP